mgnify:CR=1 FL=1
MRGTWLPLAAGVVAAVAVGAGLALAVKSMTPSRPTAVARPQPAVAPPAPSPLDADELVIAGLQARIGEMQDQVGKVKADLADANERLLRALAKPWVTEVRPRRTAKSCPTPPRREM